MKKMLILNGSPHSNGDTAYIIEKLKERINNKIEVCELNAYKSNIKPCIDCRYCWKNEGCSINDDMRIIWEDDYEIIEDKGAFSRFLGIFTGQNRLDEFMIEQVLTNYITNAIKHVDENNKIEVMLQNIDNNKLRISVYNTGIQIPEEKINKLWDRFYKLDESRNRENGGSGIGLALVKAIITKHNNKYGVENVDNGIVFYFEIDKTDEDK